MSSTHVLSSARYFDNAATTPIDQRVLEEMLPFLSSEFGNAHSIHGFGMRAMAAVEQARERVAKLIGAESPEQIFFTSGATEANNWVIDSFEKGAISPFEHGAVREPALRKGYSVLANDGIDFDIPIAPDSLLSIMTVNNETGTIWVQRPSKGMAKAFHTDATQAVGKVPVGLGDVDFLTCSAHKFYGPKGVGALYAAESPPEPLLLGGEQEHGFRAGTLNVPGIVGMGAAAAIAIDEQPENMSLVWSLRNVLLDTLRPLSDWQVNGGDDLTPFMKTREVSGNSVSPYILSLSFQKILGESLVIEADQRGFAISAGAACSSRSTEPSHVLTALGLEPEWLNGTIRISFGRTNTAQSAQELAKTLLTSVENLRTLS